MVAAPSSARWSARRTAPARPEGRHLEALQLGLGRACRTAPAWAGGAPWKGSPALTEPPHHFICCTLGHSRWVLGCQPIPSRILCQLSASTKSPRNSRATALSSTTRRSSPNSICSATTSVATPRPSTTIRPPPPCSASSKNTRVSRAVHRRWLPGASSCEEPRVPPIVHRRWLPGASSCEEPRVPPLALLHPRQGRRRVLPPQGPLPRTSARTRPRKATRPHCLMLNDRGREASLPPARGGNRRSSWSMLPTFASFSAMQDSSSCTMPFRAYGRAFPWPSLGSSSMRACAIASEKGAKPEGLGGQDQEW